jgi:hypothetical protein
VVPPPVEAALVELAGTPAPPERPLLGEEALEDSWVVALGLVEA